MYAKELKICQQAAREAGTLIKKEFFKTGPRKINYKKHDERVTATDKKSETIILRHLKKNFPNYDVLSEESGLADHSSVNYEWIIDPLDGTTNFTMHHPIFCVAIALLYKRQPVMSVVYNPLLEEMYYATRGQGAFRNSRRIHVSTTSNFKKSIISYCHGSGPSNTKKAYRLYEHFHNISHHCRHFGSTSMELAMLAAGHTQAHLVTGAHLWDMAPGVVLVREAGGQVTDWQNKPWQIKSKTILAGHKNIHSLCLKELQKIKLA